MTPASGLRPSARRRGLVPGGARIAGPGASNRFGLATVSALLPLIGLALACLDGVVVAAADQIVAGLAGLTTGLR